MSHGQATLERWWRNVALPGDLSTDEMKGNPLPIAPHQLVAQVCGVEVGDAWRWDRPCTALYIKVISRIHSATRYQASPPPVSNRMNHHGYASTHPFGQLVHTLVHTFGQLVHTLVYVGASHTSSAKKTFDECTCVRGAST